MRVVREAEKEGEGVCDGGEAQCTTSPPRQVKKKERSSTQSAASFSRLRSSIGRVLHSDVSG